MLIKWVATPETITGPLRHEITNLCDILVKLRSWSSFKIRKYVGAEPENIKIL